MKNPPPQSWKTARIAARASGLHWPFVKNFVVKALEIWVQTAGHVLSRLLRVPLALSRARVKRLLAERMSEKDKADAVEAKRRAVVKCMLDDIERLVNANDGRPDKNEWKSLV
jgi:hypothetical protein